MATYIFKLLEGSISSDWYRVNFSPCLEKNGFLLLKIMMS